ANAVTPAAQVGDEVISLEEIQEALQNELRNVERERFRLIDAKLAQVIADKLVAAEAKRRGIDPKTGRIVGQFKPQAMARRQKRGTLMAPRFCFLCQVYSPGLIRSTGGPEPRENPLGVV